MNDDFLKIARCAGQAPSGHNTQPWRFGLAENEISIKPDFDVSLPVVDQDNRELYVSLGCATENLFIAASHFGYEARVIWSDTAGIKIGLAKGGGVVEDVLFGQIEKRQTNRSVFKGDKIPDEILDQLGSVRKENNIQLYFAGVGTPLANTLTAYIMEGNEIQMDDPAFKNELLSWMRFNRKQVRATQNGLSYRVFGNPPLPPIVAKRIVSLFLKPEVQNKSDRKKIDSSSHFVICTTRHNTTGEWIALGRTLQRFLLKATETGIACAFLNQPCEVSPLAAGLREMLPVHQEYPTVILRIGYADPLPYSPRKDIGSLLI